MSLTVLLQAINAIIGSTVVHQLFSMFIPFVLLIYHRRSEDFLPSDRTFKVPGLLGWAVNVFVVCIIPVLIVFFCFPPFLPVTGTSMSKCCSPCLPLDEICLEDLLTG